MANDLKVIPKKFVTQPMDLGRTDAFSRIQGSLNQLSDYAAGEASKIFLEEARKKGEAKAFSNIGNPQESAMGLTGATRAENEAYQSATSKLLSVRLNSLLTKNYQYVSENLETLGQTALPKLTSLNDATMQGFNAQVPKELKHDIQYQFILGQEKGMAHMMEEVSTFNNKRAQESFAATFTSDLTNLTEKIFAGDDQGAIQANEQIKKTIQNYKTLGKISPAQEIAYNKQIAFAISDSNAVAGYLRAKAEGPAAEQDYLEHAARMDQSGSSREQIISGQSAIAKEMKRISKLEVEHYSYIKSEIENGIATGSISKEDDLQPYYDKLPASVIMDYRTKMLKANSEDNKLQQDIAEYKELSQSDPVKATLTPDNVKDAALEQSFQPLLDKKIQETGDPNARLTLQEMVPVASQEPGPNRLFTRRLQDAIKSSDPLVRKDGVLAYKSLNGPTPYLNRAKVLQVDDQTDRIAFMALSLASNGGETLDNAIDKAQKAIMLTSDSQRIANMEAYKAKFLSGAKGIKNFNQSFLNASGVNAANNSFAAKIYRDILESNTANMPDIIDAENLSMLQFKQSFSTSAYNKNPAQVMQYSPELVVPKANEGLWFKNQELLNFYKKVKNLEGAPIAKANAAKNFKRANELGLKLSSQGLPDSERLKLNKELEYLTDQLMLAEYNGPAVKWNMGKLKDSYTEEELYNSDLFLEASAAKMSRGGTLSEEQSIRLGLSAATSGLTRASRRPTVSIDNKSVEAYLTSSAETMNRKDGSKIYGINVDNGLGAQIPFPDPTNNTDNPEYKGHAVFVVKEFSEFLPKMSKKLNDKSISEMTEKEQNALFAKENPLSFWQFTFNKEEAIKERMAKRAAFKKKAATAKAEGK